ncbi:manganese efflux pump MntP family protein [Halosquirtibacter xylanolyticus]|uniref:manganese efflux pump MntP n=1 Tax=Halosquirtibacter xylanolyticus TaxID=3374599 RepID=UPI0037499B1E|nr:manganese efflux pump MntP family protein [Prolixibacteraceae bacterium]
MNILSIILIGIGLSIDSLAASVTMGACSVDIRRREVFKVASCMAFFQGALPCLGWIVGFAFKEQVQACDHWIAFLLLAVIGGKLFYDGLTHDGEDGCKETLFTNSILGLVGVAVATSIDAMILGVGFALIEINIGLTMFIIALTTFMFSSAGVYLGKRLGNQMNGSIEMFGGVVLVGLGVKILITHLYFVG